MHHSVAKISNSFSGNIKDNTNINMTETSESETTLTSTISSYTEPQILETIPQKKNPSACTLSDSDVTCTGEKIFFISDSEVYYSNKVNGIWEVTDLGITNAYYLEAYDSILYILFREEHGEDKLMLYNVEEETVINVIDLDESITGNLTRTYCLTCADDTGVYLVGESDLVRSEYDKSDYSVFLNISPKGEVTVLKGFSSKDIVRLALVKDNILYYDWSDDNGNYGVYSWNKDTDKTVEISTQCGLGLKDYGMDYYIWNNKLIYPLVDGGICVAILDGSSEKIYKSDSEKSFVVIGDYVYFAGNNILKVNLNTGDKTNIGSNSGDYDGTLSVFNNQLLLLRYEGTTTQPDPRIIYILSEI